MMVAWAGNVNAAATTWLQKTWTGPAAKTTAPTSAATTESVCAAHVSAKRETTQMRGTAASSASVTTSTVTALETNYVEVCVNFMYFFRYLEKRPLRSSFPYLI